MPPLGPLVSNSLGIRPAALDLGRAAAVADNLGHGARWVILVETTQPFDEVAAGLEGDGWSEEGGLWLAPDDGSPLPVVAEGRVGSTSEWEGRTVIVLAGGVESAQAAVVGGRGGIGPDRSLLRSLAGPVLSATAVGVATGDCVRAVATSETSGGEGQLVMELDGEIRTGAFDGTALARAGPGRLSFTRATANGDTLIVGVRARPPTAIAALGAARLDRVGIDSLYRCGGRRG